MFSATKGGSPSGYQISRSVRLRSSASAYFNRTPASAGNRKLWTWSGWLKRGVLGGNSGIFSAVSGLETLDIAFEGNTGAAGDTLRFVYYTGAALNGNLVSTPVYRDPSGWYHIVAVWDTDNATASNRMRLYVNGVEITAFGTSSYPSSGTVGLVNNTVAHAIGRYSNLSRYYDGYLTEINFIDGQALTPLSFGETDAVTGVWKPKKYTGTYGTNGFYLNFSDNSAATAAAIGKDYSGNGNNWTPNNISVTAGVTYDSMLDVPTQWADGGNGRGNYAVINPLNNSGGVTISDGNLKALWASASDRSVLSTFPIPSTGKFYAEFVNGTLTSASVAVAFGLATEGSSRTGMIAANMWVYYASNQSYISRNGTLSSQIGTNQTIAAGGILQVAIDRDNNQAWLGYNNVWVNATNGTTGDPSAGTNPTVSSLPADLFVMVGLYAENGNVNFGQRPFSYTPPTGFKALNTLNLPQPTILKGNQYMNANLWTGDGSSNRAITGVGFQPDFTWIKIRNLAFFHRLTDSVRGATRELYSNSTDAEFVQSQGLLSFDSDGFTIGTSTSYNGSGNTYVGWSWKANGTPAVTNTAGSITSTISAGATQGFSVVTYTGNGVNDATVGHGLGVAPSMVIVKERNRSENWNVKHASLSSNNVVFLNTTDSQQTPGSGYIGDLSSSTVITLKNGGAAITNVNRSTGTYVAYCFAAVAGFSAFGSYTGNGSADGTFVFTGFRPRYVLIKCSSAAGTGWYVYDTVRNTYNVMDLYLRPDVSDAETTFTTLDCLSNGFKLRTSNSQFNGSGSTYIYAAFAENPFKNALAR